METNGQLNVSNQNINYGNVNYALWTENCPVKPNCCKIQVWRMRSFFLKIITCNINLMQWKGISRHIWLKNGSFKIYPKITTVLTYARLQFLENAISFSSSVLIYLLIFNIIFILNLLLCMLTTGVIYHKTLSVKVM